MCVDGLKATDMYVISNQCMYLCWQLISMGNCTNQSSTKHIPWEHEYCQRNVQHYCTAVNYSLSSQLVHYSNWHFYCSSSSQHYGRCDNTYLPINEHVCAIKLTFLPSSGHVTLIGGQSNTIRHTTHQALIASLGTYKSKEQATDMLWQWNDKALNKNFLSYTCGDVQMPTLLCMHRYKDNKNKLKLELSCGGI